MRVQTPQHSPVVHNSRDQLVSDILLLIILCESKGDIVRATLSRRSHTTQRPDNSGSLRLDRLGSGYPKYIIYRQYVQEILTWVADILREQD